MKYDLKLQESNMDIQVLFQSEMFSIRRDDFRRLLAGWSKSITSGYKNKILRGIQEKIPTIIQ